MTWGALASLARRFPWHRAATPTAGTGTAGMVGTGAALYRHAGEALSPDPEAMARVRVAVLASFESAHAARLAGVEAPGATGAAGPAAAAGASRAPWRLRLPAGLLRQPMRIRIATGVATAALLAGGAGAVFAASAPGGPLYTTRLDVEALALPPGRHRRLVRCRDRTPVGAAGRGADRSACRQRPASGGGRQRLPVDPLRRWRPRRPTPSDRAPPLLACHPGSSTPWIGTRPSFRRCSIACRRRRSRRSGRRSVRSARPLRLPAARGSRSREPYRDRGRRRRRGRDTQATHRGRRRRPPRLDIPRRRGTARLPGRRPAPRPRRRAPGPPGSGSRRLTGPGPRHGAQALPGVPTSG